MTSLLALIGVVAACDTNADDTLEPVIALIAPTMAATDDLVTIVGTGFCGAANVADGGDGACREPASGFVSVGGDAIVIRANATMWRDQQIDLTVPAAAIGHTFIVVTVDGVPSAGVDFEISP